MAMNKIEECKEFVWSRCTDVTKENGMASDCVEQAATSKRKATQGFHIAGLSDRIHDVLFEEFWGNAMGHCESLQVVSFTEISY